MRARPRVPGRDGHHDLRIDVRALAIDVLP